MAYQSKTQTQPQPTQKRRKRKPLKTIAIIVLVAIVGLLIYQYIDARQEIKQLQKATAKIEQSQNDSDAIIVKVSKLTILPAEQPTVATVSDITKLKTQAFFNNAKNGDKVLIFKNTKKAIIYRPSTNQIIEIAPIVPGTDGESVSPTTTAPTEAVPAP